MRARSQWRSASSARAMQAKLEVVVLERLHQAEVPLGEMDRLVARNGAENRECRGWRWRARPRRDGGRCRHDSGRCRRCGRADRSWQSRAPRRRRIAPGPRRRARAGPADEGGRQARPRRPPRSRRCLRRRTGPSPTRRSGDRLRPPASWATLSSSAGPMAQLSRLRQGALAAAAWKAGSI